MRARGSSRKSLHSAYACLPAILPAGQRDLLWAGRSGSYPRLLAKLTPISGLCRGRVGLADARVPETLRSLARSSAHRHPTTGENRKTPRTSHASGSDAGERSKTFGSGNGSGCALRPRRPPGATPEAGSPTQNTTRRRLSSIRFAGRSMRIG